MQPQCQSKYHRNNDVPISKTCVKPSRLYIFFGFGSVLDQDWGKKWVSQIDQVLATFDIQESNLTWTKGSPHELPNLRQSWSRQMHHVHPYSMYVFLQLITDGSLNKHPRKKKKQGEEEENASGYLQKNNTSITFGSELWKENGVPKLTSFWLHFTLKECSLKFPKGSPHELPNFRQSLHWQMYDVPYSMYGFLQLIADGSPNKHQRTKKSKGRNRREYKRTPSLH